MAITRPYNRHFGRRLNANPYGIALDSYDGHRDLVAELNPFSDLASKHQHDEALLACLSLENVTARAANW
jgi:hypothetical protein